MFVVQPKRIFVITLYAAWFVAYFKMKTGACTGMGMDLDGQIKDRGLQGRALWRVTLETFIHSPNHVCQPFVESIYRI